ncbi:glycosyl hydrolase family 28-related protein [Nannocystis pusilla]|uniref:glycosyl hydrolase family 28-related protein n=1 Tax=Nannocystis pusilla TaxID=889268 RepID=UPI003B76AEE7
MELRDPRQPLERYRFRMPLETNFVMVRSTTTLSVITQKRRRISVPGVLIVGLSCTVVSPKKGDLAADADEAREAVADEFAALEQVPGRLDGPAAKAVATGQAVRADPCATGQAVRESAPSSEEWNGPFPNWKNVMDYGANPDDNEDDAPSIQLALNELRTVESNTWNVLYFPRGEYLIGSQLTTVRGAHAHNDYLGADIVGEDPETTSLIWRGPVGGTMMQLDAWYNKVSRLTFDGQNTASIGLERSGKYATYGELSDLQFKDFTGAALLLGNGTVGGQAEQAILRSRFYRTHNSDETASAIALWDANSLNVSVWNSYFEDNDTAIKNAAGGYHAYQNRFVRSKRADLSSLMNAQISIVGNTSVGSTAFLSTSERALIFKATSSTPKRTTASI